MKKNISTITNKEWVLYLSRPYNLFTSSIWYHWYESNHWTNFFNIKPPTSLLIEQPTGIVMQYWLKKEMNQYHKIRKDIIIHKRPNIITSLKKGYDLNKKVNKILKSKKETFHDLKKSVDFLCEIAFHGTILPFAILETINKYNINDNNLIKITQKLRNVSYYPEIQNKIVIPLARKLVRKQKLLKNKNFLNLMTYSELLKGDVAHIAERYKKRKKNYYFLNQYLKTKENLFWIKNPLEIVNRLNKIKAGSIACIKGQISYKGKITGIARIILKPECRTKFNKGDILITTNSNPSFMPYINKCSAMVTDEGGIMCHAAIISREKKIPCIMGTKNATILIKDGDKIEVDANKGIITKFLSNAK